MCWSSSTKMKLHGVSVVLHILGFCSASQFFLKDGDERLNTAAASIVNECFGSSERWSELLIVPDKNSDGILRKIHHQSRISNLIISVDVPENDDELKYPGKCDNYLTTTVKWRESKTTAVVIAARSAKHLEYVLCFLRNDLQRLWRPGSYFLVVSDTGCGAAGCNDMFKVIWEYWILNAVVLSPSNEPGNADGSEIASYTFNPYSGDHPEGWETMIRETVEVSISPGKFDHSWYIFNRRFTGVGSPDECADMFFDKTSNLDGYLIPVSHGDVVGSPNKAKVLDSRMLITLRNTERTVSKLLRFDFVDIPNNDTDRFGHLGFMNGTYGGIINDIYTGRSHLVLLNHGVMLHMPGFDMLYPHDTAGACLASRVPGNRPQWMNLVSAKQMWIGLGIGLIFATVVLYLQDKSQGVVSAFLNAERLIIGSSVIRTSAIVKHRTIIGSMLLAVLVIDGAIKGRFISMLSVVTPIPNIETIDDIPEDMDIYGPLTYKTLILDPKHRPRYHPDIYITTCLRDLEIGEGRQVCLANCRYVMFIAANSSIVHKTTTPVWTTHVAMFATRYWPMKDRFNFELRKLVESGILPKWDSDAAREAEVEGWKQNRAMEPPTVRPTELNDLLPAFLLLALGLSAALIVFAFEMIL